MISIISFICESGTYGSKWLKIVQMYGEKVVTRYDPTEILSGGGGHQPQGILKSWQLCLNLPYPEKHDTNNHDDGHRAQFTEEQHKVADGVDGRYPQGIGHDQQESLLCSFTKSISIYRWRHNKKKYVD